MDLNKIEWYIEKYEYPVLIAMMWISMILVWILVLKGVE